MAPLACRTSDTVVGLCKLLWLSRDGGRIATLVGITALCAVPAGAFDIAALVETSGLRMAIGNDGRVVEFVDKESGLNYVVDGGSPCALIRQAGQWYPATAVSVAEGNWQLRFADTDVEVVLRSVAQQRHVVWEVVACHGEGVEELVFCDIPLKLQGLPEDPFRCLCLGFEHPDERGRCAAAVQSPAGDMLSEVRLCRCGSCDRGQSDR